MRGEPAAHRMQLPLQLDSSGNPFLPGPVYAGRGLDPASHSGVPAALSPEERPHFAMTRPRFKRGRDKESGNQAAPPEPASNGERTQIHKKPPSMDRTSATTNFKRDFVSIAPAIAPSSRPTAGPSDSFGAPESSRRGPISFDFSDTTNSSEASRNARLGRMGKPLVYWITELDQAGNLRFDIAEEGRTLEGKFERVYVHLEELLKANQPPDISLDTIVAVQKEIVSLIADVNERRSDPALDKTGDQLCLRLNAELRNLISNLDTLASATGGNLTQNFENWLKGFGDDTKPYIKRQIDKFDEMMARRRK